VNTESDYAQWAAVLYGFDVTTAASMQAITYSYGGGTSLTGATVLAGGFSPYLSLFDATGDFSASTFGGTDCPPGANTFSGSCDDVLLDGGVLSPGHYEIALTAFKNMSFAENLGTGTLADGFVGLGNFDGNTLNYAFDVILSDQVATTPEPAGLGIAEGSGLLLLVIYRRVRRRPSRERGALAGVAKTPESFAVTQLATQHIDVRH
jgi:hypothetical protein